MKKYIVYVPVAYTQYHEVEAENAEKAKEKVLEDIDTELCHMCSRDLKMECDDVIYDKIGVEEATE